MRTFSIRNFAIILLTGLGLIVTAKLMLPKTYIVRAEAILIRFNSPTSGDNSEHSKNRWVWVRDGMEITKRLQSVDFAKNILAELQLDENQAFSLAREQLKIDYTGGDENLWIFEIKHSDPEVAKQIASAYLNKLELLGEEKVPGNEQNVLTRQQTEVIAPPTIVGDVFSMKLKTLIFAVVILALMGGLTPIAFENMNRRTYAAVAT